MENNSEDYLEYKQLRQHCGYFLLDNWGLVKIKGKDTFSFLQSQTTNDVLKLKIGNGQNNAIVDRKAKLLCNFSIYKDSETSALVLIEKSQIDTFVKSLENYHFREEIEFLIQPKQNSLAAIQGPNSPVIIEKLTGGAQSSLLKPNEFKKESICNQEVYIICKSLTGDEGYILAFPESIKSLLIEKIEEVGAEQGILQINNETQEILRIEAGLPVFGKDMDNTKILPETGLEHNSVSYHKGCYIGQEVIARIKTYGSPAFALMGLIWESDFYPSMGSEIKMFNKKLGTVQSSCFSPDLNKVISLAYVQKDFRSPNQEYKVTVNGKKHQVKTALLPFYQPTSRTDRAKILHKEALNLYKEEEDLEKPIALLRDAIALDPKYAPGYEALGVMLSKQNKLDEAIALMKRLAEIDPQEIMAHTNLSIYYMQQGRIEEAETEKAEATAIQFEKMVEQSQVEKAQRERTKQEEEERNRQIGMFQQVLEIDPNDQVANFGLGSIFFEQKKFNEALSPLQRVIENYPDYSAAYLALGKTLEKLERNEEAKDIYEKGIAAASKKGDLMPLKDMQTRLNQILHSIS